MSVPSYETVACRVDEIEAEMKSLNLWSDKPLAPEKLQFTKAFGADTMAFAQWLQFAFVPRVHELVAERGTFPTSSHVGVRAMREFDGDGEASGLVTLLYDFDALFDRTNT
jgi:uncharacterized protein YqcC (DUF446 family)